MISNRIVAALLLLPVFAAGQAAGSGASEGSFAEVSIDIEAGAEPRPLKPLFRDFAQGGESPWPEYLEGIIHWMRVLRPRMIRFDHALNSLVFRDGDGYDFSYFDKQVSVIREIGAEPLVCLSYTPSWLRPEGGREIGPPADLDLWADLIHSLVRHANSDPLRRIVYWEVWNEPNHPGFWGGSMEDYFRLYMRTVEAALRADPDIKIGGPGLAGWDEFWIDAFLDFIVETGLRMDFVSWHNYNAPPEEYAKNGVDTRAKLDVLGLSAELILDEWNFHAGMVPENDNHIGAAYASSVLRHMIDSPIDYAPFFEPKDGWSPEGDFWGRWGMFTHNEVPKANYFAFQAWSRLTEDRVPLATTDPRVDGIATVDGSRVIALVYNTHSEPVRATVSLGLETSPRILFTRWLVDATHSNPVVHAPRELQVVERGAAEAGARTTILPAHSVSLMEFRGDPLLVPGKMRIEPATGVRFPSFPAVLTITPESEEMLRWNFHVRSEDGRDTFRVVDLPGESWTVEYDPILSEREGWQFLQITLENPDGSRRRLRETAAYPVPARLDLELSDSRVPHVGETSLQATVRNNSARPVDALVEWSVGAPLVVGPTPCVLRIGPRETVELVAVISGGGDLLEVVDAVCTLKVAGEVSISKACAIVPTIEARRGELQQREYRLPEYAYRDHARRRTGTAVIHAGAMWTGDALHIGVSLVDETHVQAAVPELMWEHDSIQIALDTGFDARPGIGYDGNDVEFGVALADDGVMKHVWHSGDVPLRADLVQVETDASGGSTTFGIRVPWEALGMTPFEGMAIGFSLLVNDDDGDGRRIVPLFGDVSSAKEPYRFGAIVLRP